MSTDITIQTIHTDGSPATIETGVAALLDVDETTISVLRSRHRATGSTTVVHGVTDIVALVDPFDGRVVVSHANHGRTHAGEHIIDTTSCDVTVVRVLDPEPDDGPISPEESREVMGWITQTETDDLRGALEEIEALIDDDRLDETEATRRISTTARRAMGELPELEPDALIGAEPADQLDLFAVLRAVNTGKAAERALEQAQHAVSDFGELRPAHRLLNKAVLECLGAIARTAGVHLVTIERAARR